MIRIFKENTLIIGLIILTILTKTMHLLPQLQKVHSVVDGVSITWGDSIYYLSAQLLHNYLSVISIKFFKTKNKVSYCLSWAYFIISSLMTIDEIEFMCKINIDVLTFFGTLPKIIFITIAGISTFIIALLTKNGNS